MAGFRDLLKPKGNTDGKAQEVVKCLKKDYPYVAEMLGGSPAKDDQPALSPGSVTIFIREGKAKFTCNVKGSGIALFGDCEDIANPWGSINSALAMGEVGTKPSNEQKNSMTKEQKDLLL